MPKYELLPLHQFQFGGNYLLIFNCISPIPFHSFSHSEDDEEVVASNKSSFLCK